MIPILLFLKLTSQESPKLRGRIPKHSTHSQSTIESLREKTRLPSIIN
ncbi:uncharacterized protein METZ01_LOCUS165796, partial [marine metagenome]